MRASEGSPRISFPDDFFQDEVRDGFFVEHKMKCAWAAQMEVLAEIDRICKKYGIRYFADSGTLLGAVRHKGFIPWDDDIDIAMLRNDYRKFFSIVRAEMPEGWAALEMDEEYDELFGRVVNSGIYDSGQERLIRFHGCPYAVGVDIFPIDYVPPVKAEEEIWYLISQYLFELIQNLKTLGEDNIREKIEPDLQVMEEMCRVKFDRSGNLERQIRELLNRMVQMYPGDDAEELEYIILDLAKKEKRYKYKPEWYAESIDVPFENIRIPIPAGYVEVLRVLFGDDYMIPQKGGADHDYPFYRKQDIQLEEMRKNEGNSGIEGV